MWRRLFYGNMYLIYNGFHTYPPTNKRSTSNAERGLIVKQYDRKLISKRIALFMAFINCSYCVYLKNIFAVFKGSFQNSDFYYLFIYFYKFIILISTVGEILGRFICSKKFYSSFLLDMF